MGAGTGAIITGVNQAIQGRQRRQRDAARQEMGTLKKESSVSISFSSSNLVPASAVVGNTQLPLKSGATVASLAFYSIPGTKFVMAVPRAMAKKLEKVTDQQKVRQMLVGGMREEIRAARSNLPSPGLFLVFEKGKKGYRYLKPSPIAGMR